jgi:hypothetical protein
MTQVTRILEQLNRGDQAATAALLPLVYDELRKLAGHWLANQPAGQTLQPTALVHEAYLRLVEDPGCQSWENRGHFLPLLQKRFAGSSLTTRDAKVDSNAVET